MIPVASATVEPLFIRGLRRVIMKNRSPKSFYFALILFLLFFGQGYFTVHVHAATYTVTSAADNGSGTLRDAVVRASSGDTIVFDPGVNAIVLTSGEIVIKKVARNRRPRRQSPEHQWQCVVPNRRSLHQRFCILLPKVHVHPYRT